MKIEKEKRISQTSEEQTQKTETRLQTQGKFIYTAYFIHYGNSKCFTERN